MRSMRARYVRQLRCYKIQLVKQLQDYDEKMDCLSEQIQSQQGLVSGMIQKDLQQIRAI